MTGAKSLTEAQKRAVRWLAANVGKPFERDRDLIDVTSLRITRPDLCENLAGIWGRYRLTDAGRAVAKEIGGRNVL